MTNNIVNCCENVGINQSNDFNENNDQNYGNNNDENNDSKMIMMNDQDDLLEQQQTQPFDTIINTNNNENLITSSTTIPMQQQSHQQQHLPSSTSSNNNNDHTNYNNDNFDDSASNKNIPKLSHSMSHSDQYSTNRKGSNVSKIFSALKNQTSSSHTSSSASSTSSSSSATISCCCSPSSCSIINNSNNDDNIMNNNENYSIWQIVHMILVVIASATINGVVFGVVNNFGVFYAYLTELSKTDIAALGFSSDNNNEHSITNDSIIANNTASSATTTTLDAVVQSLIAGVGSFNVGLIFFCSIIASVLSDRYGIRMICFIGGILSTIGMYASSVSLNLIYLYITYGLVLGIGASLVYGPSLAILGHYFTKRLGLVNGLVTAGSSAFSIIMPILLRWLLDLVGIQVTFKYLSILMATLILCSLTFKEKIKRPSKQNGSAKKNLANMFFYDALWKNNLYLYWVISIPMGLFGYFVPFCHLVKHARDINSIYQGEVLVMSIGITSMIGRLITGPLADVSHINRICLQQIAFASIGVLTMLLPFVRDFPLLLVCCGLGIFDGTFISLLGPIAFDLVGPEYANQAIGLLLCFCSLPLTTGPPIAAYAYGIYGNYKLAFCLAGIPPIFAAILMINIIRMQRIQRRRTSTIRLGIDEPRPIFDDVLIVNHSHQHHHHHHHHHHYHNHNHNNKLLMNGCTNGEKLHLLINVNGQDNNNHHHHYHHPHSKPKNNNNMNGTTKLKLSNDNDDDSNQNNGSEKQILLLNNLNNNIDNDNNRNNNNENNGHHCQQSTPSSTTSPSGLSLLSIDNNKNSDSEDNNANNMTDNRQELFS